MEDERRLIQRALNHATLKPGQRRGKKALVMDSYKDSIEVIKGKQ